MISDATVISVGRRIESGLTALAEAIKYAADAYVTSQREGRKLAAEVLEQARREGR